MQLIAEKSMVNKLKGDIEGITIELEEKDNELKKEKREKEDWIKKYNKLQKNEDDQKLMQKEEFEIEIKNKNENISALDLQIKDLFQSKNHLEKKVSLKLVDIQKREKQILEKEEKMKTTIEESNIMSSEIQSLRVMLDQASNTGKEKEQLTKEMQDLEDKVVERENEIQYLSSNQTMTMGDFEVITRNYEKKIDEMSKTFVTEMKKLLENRNDS